MEGSRWNIFFGIIGIISSIILMKPTIDSFEDLVSIQNPIAIYYVFFLLALLINIFAIISTLYSFKARKWAKVSIAIIFIWVLIYSGLIFLSYYVNVGFPIKEYKEVFGNEYNSEISSYYDICSRGRMGGFNKDGCLSSLGYYSNDTKYCDKISNLNNRDMCKNSISIKTQNVSGCSSLSNVNFTYQCYYTIAIRKQDKSLCEGISDELIKSYCINQSQNCNYLGTC